MEFLDSGRNLARISGGMESIDLLGSPFFIYTNHKTLENFNIQKDLSHHQARWMEFMSQFDAKVVYIKGKENSVADALSCFLMSDTLATAEKNAQHPYTFCEDNDDDGTVASIMLPSLCGPWESATQLSAHVMRAPHICTTLQITADKFFLNFIRTGYADDAWCKTQPTVAVSCLTLCSKMVCGISEID